MNLYIVSDGGSGRQYALSVSDPDESGPVRPTESEAGLAAMLGAESSADSTVDGVLLLAHQHPELDWSNPEGALETLAILNDPEAMADMEEAEHDIAAGNLLPLDRYAPPG